MLAAEQEARAQESEAQRRQALAGQFAVAFAHFEAARWNEAVQSLRALLAEKPVMWTPFKGGPSTCLQGVENEAVAALRKPPARGLRPSGPGEQAGSDTKSESDRPKPTSLPRS